MLPLTWTVVLQDDGQEEVLGEHGAYSLPLLPPPSLLTSPSSPASWAHSLVLGCREKLIPPPSHQGRASARQDPPPPGVLKGGAKTTILGNLLGVEMR